MKKQIKQYKPLNVSLTVIFIIALALFMLTFSIGVPIYCRFLYYIQINTLKLPESTGWSYDTIKEAYDDVLNFCTLPNYPFGTGSLKWTESEAAHFADCKKLFNLNLYVLISTFVITLALSLLNGFKVITLCRPLKRRAYFYSAVAAVALPVVIALVALVVGFDNAFAAFHKIFFPGKENWVFDPNTEEVILIMPEQFFMNCAIIIGVTLVAFAAGLIIADCVLHSRDKKKEAAKTGASEKEDTAEDTAAEN